MDACLPQTSLSPEAIPQPATAEANETRWIRQALIATVCVGLLWRAVRYLGQFPIWGDEAMLLLNVLDRDYLGLTQHLGYSQVAPLLFLWLEKTALLTLGSSEWSVHLCPMLAGLFAFLIFAWACRASFPSVVAGLAIGILAVSYYPVRHACEVKPYAFDLFFSVSFAALTLEQLRRPESHRWMLLLIAATPLAVFSSYPSVFVGGAVSLVLLPSMRSASWSRRGLYVLFNVALLSSFLLHFGMVGHRQIDTEEARRTREFLRTYWKDAFPPEAWQQWPGWLLQVFTGNMLAYPFGAKHGGSTLTFALVLVGSVSLWRTRRRDVLALCWLPFALNLVAAILGKYPFGDSARITLHLAPFICILMAHGIASVMNLIPSPDWRTRTHLAFYLLLASVGVVGIARDLRFPYKTEHDREVRHVVRDLAEKACPDELVLVCHHQQRELLAELVWYLRSEIASLHWLADVPAIPDAQKSCWLVLCNHREPGIAEATVKIGPRFAGWRIVESDVLCVPGENPKMASVYCQKIRIIRE